MHGDCLTFRTADGDWDLDWDWEGGRPDVNSRSALYDSPRRLLLLIILAPSPSLPDAHITCALCPPAQLP